MYQFTALVSLLAILFYFFTSTRVARARAKFGVAAPAITGNADFERVFRMQMNTLEWLPILMVYRYGFRSLCRAGHSCRGQARSAPPRPGLRARMRRAAARNLLPSFRFCRTCRGGEGGGGR